MVIDKNLGGFAIDKEVLDWMYANIPLGTNVLEFGSGFGSNELSTYWNMYCVEHDSHWIGKFSSLNYIYAPILNGWYSVTAVLHGIPMQYSCILIDGPPGHIGRLKIMDHVGILDLSVPLIVDDTHRVADKQLFDALVQKTGRIGHLIKTVDKEFGVIP